MTKFQTLAKDLIAGSVVFLVALPLCLGIALASGAPLISGLVTGVLAGLIVSWLSGSQTSVSGPAAGLSAVVLSQITQLQAFEIFLVALFIGGVIQIGMGLGRLGFIANYMPSNVIKGLLAAIGLILILKQIPHLVGHDPDFEGEMSFWQADQQNTFTELFEALPHMHLGATVIGVGSLLLLLLWDRTRLKKSLFPAPLLVVAAGVACKLFFDGRGEAWQIDGTHLVKVPVVEHFPDWLNALHFPKWSVLGDMRVWLAGFTLAIVASLETLLNLEAVDKLDPRRRTSPPNRELLAQGIGNVLAGLLGGLPMTSVIVRSSVNINSGGQTRLSAFFHGVLLLGTVLFIPSILNLIPLSALAAILIATGVRLAPISLFRKLWAEGLPQFLPFVSTVVAILLTDLLLGVLIGLGISLLFILWSNLKRPFLEHDEHHVIGQVRRLELANQLSFLHRAALLNTLEALPENSQVIIDARATDYIDTDVLAVLHEFRDEMAPARNISLSLIGFKPEWGLPDRLVHSYVSTRQLQENLSPARVLRHLKEGNERFVRDKRLHRTFSRQVDDTAGGQYPLAVVLSCIDSRTSVELIFDLGLGDVFSIRLAGSVAGAKVLACMEYACQVAGAKLIVVLGHTGCGAVAATCGAAAHHDAALEKACPHLEILTSRIAKAIDRDQETPPAERTGKNPVFVDRVARYNVELTLEYVRAECPTLVERIDRGEIGLVGGMYDIRTGKVEFFVDEEAAAELSQLVATPPFRKPTREAVAAS